MGEAAQPGYNAVGAAGRARFGNREATAAARPRKGMTMSASPTGFTYTQPPWFLVDLNAVSVDPVTGHCDLGAAGGKGLVRGDVGGKSAVLFFSDEGAAGRYGSAAGGRCLSVRSNSTPEFLGLLKMMERQGTTHICIDPGRRDVVVPLSDAIAAVQRASAG